MQLEGKAKRIGIGVAVLAALIALGVALFDWNMLRGFVSHQVSERTGRPFAIRGDLDVKLSMTPTIRMHDIVMGNASWGSRPDMADIDLLEFRIDLWQLLKGHVLIPELSLTRPDILLEKGPSGQRNWDLGKPGAKGGEPPRIGQLNIRDGVLAYRDPALDTSIRLNISTVPPPAAGGEAAIIVSGDGRFKDEPFSLTGRGGSLLSLRRPNDPYPLEVKARIGGSRAEARGTLTDPIRLRGINLNLALRGEDLAKLYPIIGTPIPSTPPYTLVGHLDRQGQVWRFNDFRGTVGDSDLSGDFSVDNGGDKPFMRGNLVSENLDYDDLAGFIGGHPKTGPGETASPEQKQEAARDARRGRIFPDKPFNLTQLRAADADVKFRGKHIKTAKLPLDDISANLILKDGRLTLKPLNFGVAGGNVVSTISLDARKPVIATNVDATVRGIHLRRLFPTFNLSKTSVGQFGGRAKFVTTGNSFADMAAAADGNIGLAMNGGATSELLLALAQIHGDQALMYLLGGDEKARIRCAVADFKVKDGVMRTDTFLIDTTATNVVGQGTVDLRREHLNLTLRTQPKQVSFVSARAPLYIKGPFRKPDVGVDKTAIAARGAAAIALGALLSPIAALVPLVDTPEGKNHDCAVLLDHVRQPAGKE